jgi:pimeloyl-ACP methyl ester carboxylesterase
MGIAEKTAIVLLPGMDGTGELLRPLAEQLSTHRLVQLVSYPVDRSLSYEELVPYVRERLPGDRFVILGESFSGPIAIETAATESRTAGLILASALHDIHCQPNSRRWPRY